MQTASLCSPQINEEQVAVGVDPSRNALQLAILAPHGFTKQKIPLTPASLYSIDQLFEQGQEVRIGIEGGASCGVLVLLHWLRQGYDVREVNPQISKRLRECFTEAHTDENDAQGLALTVRFHPDLPRIRLTAITAAWKRLSRARARLVKVQTGLYNRLHALLMESYGAVYKHLFSKLSRVSALEFFHTFPTLDDALNDLPRVKELLGQQKAALITGAGRWEEDFYLEVLREEIRLTIRLLKGYREEIRRLEKKIEDLGQADPEVERLMGVPGIGRVLAITILGHSGQFGRFKSVDAYVAYCGLAPTLWQSGQSRVYARRRTRYSRQLRQAFLQLALTQLRVDPESRAYYDRKRQEGKSHWVAVIALARQLCKRVYKEMIKGPY